MDEPVDPTLEGPSASAWTYTVSVRSLCEFTAKQGDLDRRFTPSATATEGQLGEALVTGRRGPSYQRQVALAGTFRGLRVRGRADGFDPDASTLEEIKAIRGEPERIPANRRHLHWAQLHTYGALYCREHGLDEIRLALVYIDADTQEETVVAELRRAADLDVAFTARCQQFLDWAQQEAGHRQSRDAALNELVFPLPAFRKGQRELAEAVYRAAVNSRCLLAQAPTGIGKTLGVLYPLMRAIPHQKLDKVAYLTCKTTGRLAALDALERLRSGTKGHALRVLVLVAKEQACDQPGKACHGDSCPLARGFYDRLPAARQEAADAGWLDQAALRRVAAQHGICHYYLGQEMMRWADVLVGDIHHALDPNGQLYALTQSLEWRVALMIDEAHNLVERTRKMYSASLKLSSIDAAAEDAPPGLRPVLRRLQRQALAIADTAGGYVAFDEVPTAFSTALSEANVAMGEHFGSQPFSTEPLLNFYFEALQLQWTIDRLGPHSFFDVATVAGPSTTAARQSKNPQADLLQVEGDEREEMHSIEAEFCVRNIVPGAFLKRRWLAFQSVVLFSATLGSEQYQRDLLGLPENAAWIDIESPFDPDHLCVQVAARVSTRYAHREKSLNRLVDLMAQQIADHPGNYLAFFSSFAYLQFAVNRLAERAPHVVTWRQSGAMHEAARRDFLDRFTPAGSGIGFAVLGGAFAEGIDLPGTRLIGAFIATLGLPPVSRVQEQMRLRLDAQYGLGHGYSDVVPGMQKVAQAAGRVIRRPADRGWLWLLDDRYDDPAVRALLPAGWFSASPMRA